MNTRAAGRHFLAVIGFAAALTVYPSDCPAQAKPSEDHPMPAPTPHATEGYDIVIRNGVLTYDRHPQVPASLKAVVEVLREQYTEANIVFAPELADVEIPDLKLRARDLPEVLEAIRVASGNKFDWLGPHSPEPNVAAPMIDPATGLPGAAADASAGLFVLREPRRTAQNERVVEAFNLEPFIEAKLREYNQNFTDQTQRQNFALQISKIVEDLIVETVASFERVDVNEAQRKIEFRFHPGASVLIAIGKAEDIQVARMVENALTGEEVASNRGSSSSFSSQLRKIGDAASHPGGASVGSAAKPELSVETFPLKFASLGSAGQAAFALLTDSRSKVINDERANTLVVVATKPELSAIKKAIEQIDHGSKPFVGDNPAGPSAQPR